MSTAALGRQGLAEARSTAGSVLRRVLRHEGYDVVPLAGGFTELQRRLLPTADVVVDVGANVGQYRRLVRGLGFAGPVVSFEPGADAYAALRTAATADPQWETRRLALADAQGEATLQVSRNSVSSSLLSMREEHIRAAPGSEPSHCETVPVSTLDAELTGIGGAKWLKLDVQGAEMAVLRGGERILRTTVVIQTEMSLSPLYDGQTDFLELSGFLRDEGFRLCHVLPGFRDTDSGHLLQMDGLFVRTSE